jgi:ribonucleoside-diphosphate reductase alpha chain
MHQIVDHPDFGILGSRIMISNHQKNTPESFYEVVKILSENRDILGELSPLVNDELVSIAEKYKNELQNMLDMSRDYLIDFFGFKTMERSYLLRINNNEYGKVKKIIERPQHLFLRVAIGIHGDDLESVKKTYDSISLKMYTHATPTLFNACSNTNQLASCFLLGVEDSIEGIFDAYRDCGMISKFAGGIGVHISEIRSKGSYIRKTGGNSDGLMPLLKTFNSVARQFNQSGKRLGSFAMYLEPWHSDILTFLEAKKNSGSDEERARDLFYALWVCDLFMIKIEKDEDWYLMDPNRCPNLANLYGDEFEKLYLGYVSENKFVKKMKARELWEAIISSQIEHGMPYICYKDSVNRKSNQKNIGTIRSSNLCVSGDTYILTSDGYFNIKYLENP